MLLYEVYIIQIEGSFGIRWLTSYNEDFDYVLVKDEKDGDF